MVNAPSLIACVEWALLGGYKEGEYSKRTSLHFPPINELQILCNPNYSAISRGAIGSQISTNLPSTL